MLRKIIFIITFFICNCLANEIFISGPFFLKEGGGISIGFIKNNDESISLIEMVKDKSRLVDKYEVGDGVPAVETVFFDKLKNEMKLVILISWDEPNISAVHYKVIVYNYNSTRILDKDKCLEKDKNLEGYDGYSGNGMVFNLKNAGEIKKYLRSCSSSSVIECG